MHQEGIVVWIDLQMDFVLDTTCQTGQCDVMLCRWEHLTVRHTIEENLTKQGAK